MAELRRRRSVSQAHLLSLLESQLDDLVTGRMAAARRGRPRRRHRRHRHPAGRPTATGSRSIDPSPDALASLERRTAEAELTGRITGRQGDAADLVELIGAAPGRRGGLPPGARGGRLAGEALLAMARRAAARRRAQPAGRPAARAGAQPGAGRPHRAGPAELRRPDPVRP